MRRFTNSNGTNIITYPFGSEEHQYSSVGLNQWNIYYYFLAGRLLGALDGNGTQFYLVDALGSLVSAFNTSQGGASLKSNQLFGPYGNGRYYACCLNTAKGFLGQYNDGTGLDYLNARYYDPVVGVFLSADTVQGNLQGMNPYGYVNGNPETYGDPTGKYMATVVPLSQKGGAIGYSIPGTNIVTTVINTGYIGSVTTLSGQVRPDSSGLTFNTFTRKQQDAFDSYRADTSSHSSVSGMLQHLWEGIKTFWMNFWTRVSLSGEDSITCAGMLSFSPATKVATIHGAKAIGSLKPGQRVWAFNTKTHKMELEPVLHVWINHDNDLVDVTVEFITSIKHGKSSQKTSETIHTNEKHPFLTVEEGFIPVSQLRIGMHVINANGGIGTIAILKTVPGTMTMYNLEVAQDHTFTVGKGERIVHNCGSGPLGNGGFGSNQDPTANLTMQDLLNNPQLLRYLSPQQVEQIVVRDGGWVTGPLRKSSLPGETFNQLNPKGTAFTDKYIQWHAGGGRHGSTPYWKVSTNKGTVRVDYEGPDTIGGDIPGEDTPPEDIPPDLIDP